MKHARSLLWLATAYIASNVPLLASFGAVTGVKTYAVDTGAGLVLQIDKGSGNLSSIKFKGTELNTAKASGINSGLGSAGTATAIRSEGDTIVIEVSTDASNQVVKGLKHYYIFRKDENVIYMATYTDNEPSNGEFRWITRLQSNLLPVVPVESDIRDNKGAIESKDIFGAADGTTRSKYYGNQQAAQLAVRGVKGPGRGVFMVYGNRESSSGGPFFRDIQNQTGSASEVYNYLNSGHNQTEAKRAGILYGPYALVFTTGAVPAVPEMDFIGSLGLAGYVGAAGRGSVGLKHIEGRLPDRGYTLGFANSAAQYWTAVTPAGMANCRGMKPGEYVMKIYKGELAVFQESVTVTAGKATIFDSRAIAGDPSFAKPVWRIGEWDGTPLEFRNGANIPRMHPSDKRQAPWKAPAYLIGRSRPGDFPACQWRDVNDNQLVKFQLNQSQLGNRKLRIGITAAYAGGRPRVSIGGWVSPLPGPSDQPDSRSITIGTYRGNNKTYMYDIPAKALVQGTNTLTISVVSGKKGGAFLSPGYAIDCVDLL